MIEPRAKSCPCCGGEHLVVCRLKGTASAVGKMNRESALFAEICVDCGQVVLMRAEHPEKLKGEFDR